MHYPQVPVITDGLLRWQDHAVVLQDGHLTDLNSLIPVNSGWHLEHASDINNKGQIAGGPLQWQAAGLSTESNFDWRRQGKSLTV
jgi:hypothetical protein